MFKLIINTKYFHNIFLFVNEKSTEEYLKTY